MATDASADASPDVASDASPSTDLRARPDAPADSVATAPAGVSFPDPPRSACATASDCDFPPSACADRGCDGGVCPGLGWVVYFDQPECVSGSCVFERLYFQCSGLYQCAAGGCRYSGTAVSAP